ncbi:MAG: hypothetical protein HWQ44_13345 [Nostoc sp. JL34]|nr:hypothetical protein [Nostoc sp. JL34]MBN3883921.1 hypothetical protein [Nostoc sp. JL34]
MPLDWGKKAIASFPDAAIALFLLVSLLCLHNTLNLDLAKPYKSVQW